MKKKYTLNQEQVKVIKDLGLKDKQGAWFQIEMLEGKEKGLRRPACLEEDGDFHLAYVAKN